MLRYLVLEAIPRPKEGTFAMAYVLKNVDTGMEFTVEFNGPQLATVSDFSGALKAVGQHLTELAAVQDVNNVPGPLTRQ